MELNLILEGKLNEDYKEKDEELRVQLEEVEAHYARLVGMEEVYINIIEEYIEVMIGID